MSSFAASSLQDDAIPKNALPPNMTLRSRLAVGLVTIAIILVGPLVFAIQSLRGLHDDAQALRDREMAASLVLGHLREGLSDLRRQELSLLFSKDSAATNTMDKQVNLVATLADSLSHFQLPSFGRDIRASIQKIADVAPAEYRAALAGNGKLADSLSDSVFVPAMSSADTTIRTAEQELRARTAEAVSTQATAIDQAASVSISALALALVIAASVAFFLTRFISHPIDDLKRGMSAVADGDLEYALSIPKTRSDEFGQLAKSFGAMTLQLSELDKLKAEFVSVASHELKTPINVIIGYLQLLEEGLYGPLTAQQEETIKTVVSQANTLSRLVKQLLDVSRFEAGGGRLEPRPIKLGQLLTELESAFHVLAAQREVNFTVRGQDGLPNEVVWDLDRVNEVLGNLLSNAFKFTPHGGTVELTVERVDGSVRMAVCDT
ncbi:MAG TPA: HAMP domain-containing sensor histidine kinase, partial [Gemmatimonadaceae bacterium]|nr:HAMP domain-containing sensor histidine kinase [Gemmatimonadaceae bacterium]